MSESSPIYDDVYTPTFDKQLKKLKKTASVRFKRVQNAIQTILAAPYQNIDFGKGIYRGKRKWRVGSDRIIFVVCKQCRELEHQIYNQCNDCDSTPDETVIFVTIIEGHKY